MNEKVDEILDDDIIDKHLIHVYFNSHRNDMPDNLLPETDKYPPLNESMMAVPPKKKDWLVEREKEQQMFASNSPNFQPHSSSQQITPQTIQRNANELIGITFRTYDCEDNETSVMICDTLSYLSTMEDVLKEGEVFDDLGLDDNPDDYKYVIRKKSKGSLTLKWRRFQNLTVQSLLSVHNIDENYMIALKV